MTNITINPRSNPVTITRIDNVNVYVVNTDGTTFSYTGVNVEIVTSARAEVVNIYSRGGIFDAGACIHCYIAGTYQTIEIN